jgi:hypothetical protein
MMSALPDGSNSVGGDVPVSIPTSPIDVALPP